VRTEERSLKTPADLIDAAERLSRLPDLGRTVRERAAEDFAGSDPDAVLFMNLHPCDLVDPELRSVQLSSMAHRIVLEVTERASLEQIKDVRANVAELRSLGFRIAVDDLGAGYAGLTSFALLEPEIVKIDMSLVRDVYRHSTKRKLIGSIAALCRDMGILLVGEGVETAVERDALTELGCDLLQGYLHGRPSRGLDGFLWGD
jgi:EAL domain-containing protein (putative c-di-GMP-specific phosphodiesterase class I)